MPQTLLSTRASLVEGAHLEWTDDPVVATAAVPVGLLVLLSVAEDPATLLGFGTWAFLGIGTLPLNDAFPSVTFYAWRRTT